MTSILDDLNPEQREAAEHGEGPALVLAGPGTGKTHTLVARYAYLVQEREVDPRSIFTTTFSKKTELELHERIEPRIGRRTRGLPIGTFHALALRMLKEIGHLVGFPRKFRVLETGPAYAVLRSLDVPKYHSSDELLERFGRFKNLLIDPKAALKAARTAPAAIRDEELEVAHAYAQFQDKAHAQGLYDFGDMLMLCVQALRADDDVRAGMSERYAWVMVDEFQDVNLAQVAMVEALCETHDNLWVVGDDDQAIYGWRGSDVGYITGFEEDHPGARIVRLRENYRSPPVILEAAGRLIGHNRQRLAKELVATKPAKPSLVAIGAANEEDEARRIAAAVQKLAKAGMAWEEMAVLVRARHQFVHLEAALAAARIPFTIAGGGSFWSMPVVRTVVAVLRDATDQGRVRAGMDWLAESLQDTVTIYRRKPFPVLADEVAKAAAKKAPRSATHERQREWADAALEVGRQARGFEDATAFLVHAQQAARSAAGEAREAVALSTIHQAKGLQWGAVFLAGCRTGMMPHERADDDEEERRLAYVAATRTKRYLTVSWPSHLDDKPISPSPYVSELFGGLEAREVVGRGASWKKRPAPSPKAAPTVRRIPANASVRGSSRASPVEMPDLSRPSRRPRKEPARVLHDQFGMGTVLADQGEKWTVEFDRGGRKKVHRDWLTLIGG